MMCFIDEEDYENLKSENECLKMMLNRICSKHNIDLKEEYEKAALEYIKTLSKWIKEEEECD